MNELAKIAERQLCAPALETRLWVRAQQVSLQASVGIYRGEKSSRQEILLNMAAEVSEPDTDRIAETVDYRRLVEEATRLSAEGHFELIETFICELGRRICELEQVHSVEIELYKPAAIAPAMASVRYEVRKTDTVVARTGWR
ncbi:Dihydroneopterin aldolase [Novosphingobium resinovorum]|uniref:Dihydroneopterin aldolase n=1 Tax=Novosphingobium resinovorum TaxID=158500 RepID=A0A031K3Y9_9SPHN|nr:MULTISPECIES: dihydroneopterin aldolase [Novosphingobium]EZP83955.1 Dihydroneopterin aldolase [Novosphingobium resinovorum]